MDGAGWDEVTALFGKALKVPPHERAAFLDQVCGSDTALRAQVEALLDAHEEAPGYFDDLAEAVIGPEWIAEEQAEASPAEASTIDPHQIIGQPAPGDRTTRQVRLNAKSAGLCTRQAKINAASSSTKVHTHLAAHMDAARGRRVAAAGRGVEEV